MRNKPPALEVYLNDKILCLHTYRGVEKDKIYKVIGIDDDNVIIEDAPYVLIKIERLYNIERDINACQFPDVKKTLIYLYEEHENKIYFEDIFITIREQRRLKLEKLKKNEKDNTKTNTRD